jgi:Ca2+/H+ antiporter, TMEM165/GDT1 family
MLIPLAVAGFVGLLAFIVYSLWNGVLVDVVAVKTITYWQALGLLVLSKILFGGFPCGRRGCGSRRKERIMAKYLESLDPGQRERMRAEMRHRFGEWPRPMWCGGGVEKSVKPDKTPDV